MGLIQSIEYVQNKNGFFPKEREFSSRLQHRNPTWISNLLACGIQTWDFKISSCLNFQPVNSPTDFILDMPAPATAWANSLNLSISLYLAREKDRQTDRSYWFCFSRESCNLLTSWSHRCCLPFLSLSFLSFTIGVIINHLHGVVVSTYDSSWYK